MDDHYEELNEFSERGTPMQQISDEYHLLRPPPCIHVLPQTKLAYDFPNLADPAEKNEPDRKGVLSTQLHTRVSKLPH